VARPRPGLHHPLGTPIEPRNFNRSFHARCARAGVGRIRVHDTRHTRGSLLAALDVHPRVAMQILRHSKISITMEIYTEVPDASTREALRRLGERAWHDSYCCTFVLCGTTRWSFTRSEWAVDLGGAKGSRTPDLLHAMQFRVLSDQTGYGACLRLLCLEGSGGVLGSAENG
jgi:Phage integrase family